VVRVLGQKEDVLPYLQEADLFVGVSRAALEAMSCGIPVILSGNEGYLGLAVGEILPLAEQGNFCARGHRKPKADRLFRDIISAFSDEKRLEEAKGDALRYVRVYHSAEQMAEKTLQVYRAAILDSLKSRQSDVLLCGYYGYGNLGDELTLRAIVKRLRESDGEPRQDEDDASSSKGSLPPLRISAPVPRGTHYEGLICIDRFSPVALLRAIRGTGLLILGGGSLLQNKTSNRSLLYYLSLLKIAQGLGVPTMLYAGGIGPLHGRAQIALCRSILQKTDRISVRDTSSLALLKKLGVSEVRLSADPVLFCRTPQRTPEDYILTFIRREESSRFLDFFRNQSHPIRLAVMDRACDLSATKRLARILRKHGKEVTVCELSSMEDLFKQIGGARLVISARLHALILAFCMGVPFVGLSDDPKITSFVRTAYDGVLCPVTREVIAEHFRGKRRQQLALAQTDAETAIALTKRKLFP
jgi:polysaccharide pyruvyl transferase CsaB